jgi:CelD/BcsL family acetyltransferase involved in cellulose biosynthesis
VFLNQPIYLDDGLQASTAHSASSRRLGGPVNVSVCHPRELGATEVEAWHGLQRRGALENPFFSPEFARAIGEVQESARIAVVYEGSELVGFLPFSARPLRNATALAGTIANCQAFVCSPLLPIPLADVVRGAGLSMFEFHALAPPAGPLPASSTRHVDARAIDLAHGWDAFRVGARRHRSFKEIERKRRRLDRERAGEVAFTLGAYDGEVIGRLLRWKLAQLRRSGRREWLLAPGMPELVERLAAAAEPSMSGCVSSLRVGGRLVAADLSLRSTSVLAGWLMGYDAGFAAWSPGAVLLLRLVEAAAAAGVRTIDLATGDERFKGAFTNVRVELACGWVGRASVGMLARRLQRAPLDAAHRYIVARPALRSLTRHTLRRYGQARMRLLS